MWWHYVSSAWLAFVAIGLIHISVYMVKLASSADALNAKQIAASMRISALLGVAMSITSCVLLWDALFIVRDPLLISNPGYMLSRGLMTLAILSVWTPCWKLCNESQHYWPLVGIGYGSWVAFWSARVAFV